MKVDKRRGKRITTATTRSFGQSLRRCKFPSASQIQIYRVPNHALREDIRLPDFRLELQRSKEAFRINRKENVR